jgi:chromosome partitioning protein
LKRLALASTKGGSGKSTLATHLAAWAEAQGMATGIIDCDPQGSAALWHQLREAETPRLAQLAPDQLAGFDAPGVDLLIVDSAPAHSADVTTIARAVDFVLIPARPALFDLDGVRSAVELVAGSGTPGAIILNACPPGRGVGEASVTVEARKALQGAPLSVVPVSITQRAAFAHALNSGAAVHEFEPDGKAAKEIAALWQYLEEKLR